MYNDRTIFEIQHPVLSSASKILQGVLVIIAHKVYKNVEQDITSYIAKYIAKASTNTVRHIIDDYTSHHDDNASSVTVIGVDASTQVCQAE